MRGLATVIAASDDEAGPTIEIRPMTEADLPEVALVERIAYPGALREGEEVLMAGPTLKRAMGGGAHPKFLMLTTAPRLFYVDVASSTPKELSMHAAATSKATLQVVRKNRKVRLQCVIHSAEAWQREISKAPIA